MPLTLKQEAFINEYLRCWNASEAARRAGYSEKTAHQIGYENLRKLEISEEINKRVKEMAMRADEALIRLSDQARGDMADFITVKGGLPFVDLDKAQNLAKLHLLKKFKVTGKSVEIELHDSQAALVHILRELHLRSNEPTDHVVVNDSLSDEQRANRIAQILNTARTRRDGLASEE